MKKDVAQQLKNLGAELRMTRDQLPLGGAVLFVGGESSTIEGRPVIEALRRRVLSDFDSEIDEEQLNRQDAAMQISQFDRIWSNLGVGAQIAYWNKLQEKLQPTDGLRHLAELLKERYFPVVLTTNVDQLIESIFIASMVVNNQALRQWSVLVNGRDQPLTITEAIQNNTAQTTTLIKLCGDFQSRQASLTIQAVKNKAAVLKEMLATLLNGWNLDLIAVGLTPLDDVLIEYFPSVNGKVTLIGRSRAFFPYFGTHNWRNKPDYIIDEDLTFDVTFQELAKRLNVLRLYSEATGGKQPDSTVLKQVDETVPDSQPMESVVAEIVKAEQEKEKQEKREAGSESPRSESLATSKAKGHAPVASTDTPQPLIELVDEIPEEETEGVPSVEFIRNTIFTIHVNTERQINFDLSGGILNYTSRDAKTWSMDTANINLWMQDLGYDIATYHRLADLRGFAKWRRQVKREGERLYNDLIQEYPDLDRHLAIARQAAEKDPANLTLIFEGPRHHLGIPYELLRERDAYLAIKHPLCRKVSGIQVRHTEMFDEFLFNLRKKKQALRVLLIASDVDGRIPKVDQEIDELKAIITRQAQRLSMRMDDPKVIHSNNATIQEVKKQLEHCKYHIVHYAGHSGFDEVSTENSGLRLWKQTFGGKEKVLVTARELGTWLAGSETRLFYLSSCTGAWTGNEQAFINNDYLGIMDAVASGGIPYVFGFRWYVSDDTSRDFARTFYEDLFRRPHSPERAAWTARSTLYATYGERDETWASPILIAQNPYLAR
jgi:CHAT domain-containing protein